MISFRDYAIIQLAWIDAPDVKNRFELIDYMTANCDVVEQMERYGKANEYWSEYVEWSISLNPVRMHISFKAYVSLLKKEQITYDEWCVVNDIKKDNKFPGFRSVSFDKMLDYMMTFEIPQRSIAALERLWIRFNTGEYYGKQATNQT